MNSVWRVSLDNVLWPTSQPVQHTLVFELWGVSADAGLPLQPGQDAVLLRFEKYLPAADVPIWSVLTPEYQLFTNDASSTRFFEEFASLDMAQPVVLLAAVSNGPGSREPERKDPNRTGVSNFTDATDHLAIYAHEDGDNGPLRIYARALCLQTADYYASLEKDNASNSPKNKDDLSVEKLGAGGYRHHGIVQQVVLAALRLRGVKRSDPEFKQLYSLSFKSVIYSLRNKEPSQAGIDVIRDKVESLLNLLE